MSPTFAGHHTIQLIGGPMDGQTMAVDDTTWQTGILQYTEPQPLSYWDERPWAEAIQTRQGHYYRHGQHENIWLHESVSYEASHN